MSSNANPHDFHLLNTVSNMRWERNYGRCGLILKIGALCVFNESFPTNHMHRHSAYEACYIIDGRGEAEYAGDVYPLQDGDLTVVSPDMRHEIRRTGDDMLRLFYFQFNLQHHDATTPSDGIDRMLERFAESHRDHVSGKYHLLSYLHFINSHAIGRPQGDIWVERAVRNFALECIELLAGPTKTDPPERSDAAKDILDNALSYLSSVAHRKVNIDAVAAHCHTSPRNLQLLFRQRLGTTVTDWLSTRRASLAAGELLMGLRVAEVGRRVGIEDPAQFSRFFKRHFGVSPRQYQARHAPRTSTFDTHYCPPGQLE